MMTSEEQFEKWWKDTWTPSNQPAAFDLALKELAGKSWLEATRQAYEDAANILNISRSDALLMAGEMTAQEWRTVSAILTALQARLKELMP